jgi:hypothetical protein
MLQAAEWRGEDCHRRLNLGKGQPLRLLRMSINRNNERLCIFGIIFFVYMKTLPDESVAETVAFLLGLQYQTLS